MSQPWLQGTCTCCLVSSTVETPERILSGHFKRMAYCSKKKKKRAASVSHFSKFYFNYARISQSEFTCSTPRKTPRLTARLLSFQSVRRPWGRGCVPSCFFVRDDCICTMFESGSKTCCLISGASRGFGRSVSVALARQFSDSGTKGYFILISRSGDDLEETRKRIVEICATAEGKAHYFGNIGDFMRQSIRNFSVPPGQSARQPMRHRAF